MSDLKMIDKYKIIEVIGEGGMGKVYRAIHPTLKKDIIIKRLSISGKKVLSERFRREARIMMDFHHENIVSVYDHFKHGQSYYIVMEFVDGISLDKLIEKRKRIPPLACLLIFTEICKGLKYAHDKGVIHRDIKPSNVLISRNGEVKLFDFGIATQEEEEEDKDLTHTGMMMGTPSYMSPEQLADSKRVDKRSDIYSMGILLYQMLTGKRPFAGNFSSETIRKISKGKYEKPRKLVANLPRFFEKVLKRTMNHRISRRYRDLGPLIHKLSQYLTRYKTQEDIHQAIQDFINEPENKESAFEKMPRSKRKKTWLFLLLLFLGAVVATTVFFVRYTALPGLVYELFSARELGALEIKIDIPVNYFKKPEDIFAKALLKRIKDKPQAQTGKSEQYIIQFNPPLQLVSLLNIFGLAPNSTNPPKANFLTSQILYLPPGNYQLELTIEKERFISVFYLNPLSVQKQHPDSPERRKIISFSLKDVFNKEIPVKHLVFAAKSNQELSSQTKISVATPSGWTDWKNFKGLLQTGLKYRLRYEAVGYYPQEIQIEVNPSMEELTLSICLHKIPGQLTLVADSPDLTIFLDNNSEYYNGWPEKTFISLGKTDKKPRIFKLDEGEYILSIKKDDKTFANYAFTINSAESLTLYVSYHKDQGQIKITK